MKKSLLLAVFAGLFAASSFVAKAQTTYISNLAANWTASADITTSQWMAQKFKTDNSAASFTLNSVVLNLDDAVNTSGGFFVNIYNTTGSEGAWLPSGVLGTVLAGSENPATAGNYTYTASGITLLADTNYWIVAKVSWGAGQYKWGYTTSETTTGSWSITASANTRAYSLDSGSSWINGDGNPYIFAVNATAVPEPSMVLLLLVGGGVLAFIRRHQVRKA